MDIYVVVDVEWLQKEREIRTEIERQKDDDTEMEKERQTERNMETFNLVRRRNSEIRTGQRYASEERRDGI